MIKRSGLIVLGLMVSTMIFAQTNKEVKPLNEFSFSFYDELKKEHENVFFSPLSTYLSLGIISSGAAGSTKMQLDSVLRLSKKVGLDRVRGKVDEMVNRGVGNGKIRLANGCWVDHSVKLKKQFLKEYAERPNSRVESVDMNAPKSVVDYVNAWANKTTEGTIPNLLSESTITPQTRMILCNSLYMNLPWELAFKPRSTYRHLFTDQNNNESLLKFMFKLGYMEYSYEKDFHLIVRNLGEGDQALCIIVPKDGHSLAEVEEQLTAKKLSKLMNRTYDQLVGLSLPKFTMEGEYDFKQPLKNMGANEMFGLKADLSEMTTTESLLVESIRQKVKIDVNEKRIVATAVTVVRSGQMSAVGMPDPEEPLYIAADRPFMFFIIDKPTNGIFFMGRYAIPSKGDIVSIQE